MAQGKKLYLLSSYLSIRPSTYLSSSSSSSFLLLLLLFLDIRKGVRACACGPSGRCPNCWHAIHRSIRRNVFFFSSSSFEEGGEKTKQREREKEMKSAFIPKGRQTLQRLPWTTRYVEEEQIPRLSKGKNRWRDLITPPPIPRYVVVLVAAHFFSFFTPRLGLFYSSLSLSPLLSFSLEIIPRSRTSVESGGRLNSFIRPTTPLYPATYYWPLWAAGFSLLFFFFFKELLHRDECNGTTQCGRQQSN